MSRVRGHGDEPAFDSRRLAMSSSGWPDRLPILTGNAWALGLDVTVDLILPPRREPSADLARLLLTPVDPSFPDRVRRGDFVVGGGGFARGTTDDAPVRAFLASGIAALIAYTFDAAFAAHALALGLPAVEVHEALGVHTGERLRLDLEGGRVVNLSSGDRYPIRNTSDAMLACLREHLARG